MEALEVLASRLGDRLSPTSDASRKIPSEVRGTRRDTVGRREGLRTSPAIVLKGRGSRLSITISVLIAITFLMQAVGGGLPQPASAAPTFWLPWQKGTVWSIRCGVGQTSNGCAHGDAYNYHAWDANVYQGSDLVTSVADGVVFDLRSDIADSTPFDHPHSGNCVLIDHGDGYFSLYAHLAQSSIPVSKGQRISHGTVIGRMSNSGYASGKHLHWSVGNDAHLTVGDGCYQTTRAVSYADPDAELRQDGGVPRAGRYYESFNDPTPPPPPPSCGAIPSNAYCVEYFNGTSLGGNAVAVGQDSAPLSHDWGSQPPAAGVGASNFSARWRGNFAFAGGEYDFRVNADDGVRVKIDGNDWFLNEWRDQGNPTFDRRITVPAGTHLVTVEYFNNAATGAVGVRWEAVNPPVARSTITLSKTSGKYNGVVEARMTGFASNAEVALRWDGASLVRTTADGTGAARVSFRVPLDVFGGHTVRANDGAGHAAEATFRVIPRIKLTADSGRAGSEVRVYFYGFSPRERVEVRWYDAGATSSTRLTTLTVADNGRASAVVTIPRGARVGSGKVVGKVVDVSRSASTPFRVTGSSAAVVPARTATPTTTATPTKTAAATPTAVELEVPATATPEATETPTTVPTTTPTEAPPTVEPTVTETPTATPTAEPTETATPEPTSTPMTEAPPVDPAAVVGDEG